MKYNSISEFMNLMWIFKYHPLVYQLDEKYACGKLWIYYYNIL